MGLLSIAERLRSRDVLLGDVFALHSYKLEGEYRCGELDGTSLYRLVPTALLRACGCDIAERAMKREQLLGREPDDALWKAIELGRLYLHDATQHVQARQQAYQHISTTLKHLQCEPDDSFDETKPKGKTMTAWTAAHATRRLPDMCFVYGQKAAGYHFLELAPDASIPKQEQFEQGEMLERNWQIERLAWLCEVWDKYDDTTPQLILEGTLPIPTPTHVAISHKLSF
jgi:hypothetical protein